jgi:hypothetical protein
VVGLHNKPKAAVHPERKLTGPKKKLAASSMLHEAKVAYYAFDVAARF